LAPAINEHESFRLLDIGNSELRATRATWLAAKVSYRTFAMSGGLMKDCNAQADTRAVCRLYGDVATLRCCPDDWDVVTQYFRGKSEGPIVLTKKLWKAHQTELSLACMSTRQAYMQTVEFANASLAKEYCYRRWYDLKANAEKLKLSAWGFDHLQPATYVVNAQFDLSGGPMTFEKLLEVTKSMCGIDWGSAIYADFCPKDSSDEERSQEEGKPTTVRAATEDGEELFTLDDSPPAPEKEEPEVHLVSAEFFERYAKAKKEGKPLPPLSKMGVDYAQGPDKGSESPTALECNCGGPPDHLPGGILCRR